jgi:DNA-binding CsgD family transcriptional regulator
VVSTLRSPVLVGRREELATVAALLDGLRRGHGGVALVVGEAGIGKSRLLAEAAARARRLGLLVLRGRAVEGGGTYRAVAEALAGRLRDNRPGYDRLAERADLRPYRAALGRLVPGWARPDDASQSTVDPTVVLGEGLLRLLGDTAGCLLVLEDLHWADADTLALVEYLAGAAPGWPVLIAASARDEPPSSGVVGRLTRLDGVTTLSLTRLDASEVGALAEHCSAGRPLPEDVLRFLIDKSEGLPFLVEELLAGVLAAGPPSSTAGGPLPSTAGGPLPSTADGPLPSTAAGVAVPVPPTLAGLVARRLATLTPEQRRVVEAAAVLGTDPDYVLLAAVAEMGEAAVVDALRAAADGQLLVSAADGLRWRHALTRDAVLATVFAPQRAALARRAAAALQHRGGPDDDVRTAELLAAAGDTQRSAEIFLRLARRDLVTGALRSADDLLARAAATRALRPAVAVERVRLLTLRGEPAAALEIGAPALDEVAGDEHAELCLRLAQAAIAASRWPEAERYVERAGRPDDPRSLVLAADAAFGAGDLDRAASFATAAADRAGVAAGTDADVAQRRGRAEALCEALTVIGRCAMRRDPTAARAAFARAAQIAAEHGLRPWRVTALMGVGSIELFDHVTSEAVRETRELAMDTGMLAVVMWTDQVEVGRIFCVHGPRAAEEPARQCAEQAGRLRLYRSQTMADLFVAAGRAVAGDGVAMDRVLDVATARPHASAEVRALAPTVRGLRHLVAHDLVRASALFDTGVAELGGPDGSSAPVLVWGLWVLLRTVLDDRGAEARETVRGSPALLPATNRAGLQYADAIAAWRAGRHGDAEAVFAAADNTLAGWHWWRRLLRLHALEAAVADGWGEAVAPLRADLEAFERTGDECLARTCRDVLRRAGAPTRRGRGRTAVPAYLRGIGVTTREMDVLALVADGLTNREIAQRLFVSPRTVETHVANLLAKTGTASRAELRVLAAAALTP